MTPPNPHLPVAITKARQVLSASRPGELDVLAAFEAMRTSLESYACALTGDPERDIDRVSASLEDAVAVFGGYAGDRVRLLVSVKFDPADQSAEIAIRATKGSLDITELDWGSAGPRVGNGALVPRLLQLGIVTLRGAGVRFLRNEPWDDRLRSLYSVMGFRDGEELDLDDLEALTKAFDYIERAYRRFGLSLADP